MNSKHIMTAIACAAALCGSVRADETNRIATAEAEAADLAPASGWHWAMGEGVTYGETPIVSAEAGIAFDSKFLSYGFVDNNEPIMTPGASVTLGDWLTFNVEAIFDVTRYGAKTSGGERLYENRQFQYQELDPGVALGHAFGPDDAAWLPTTVAFEIGYSYEYHPRSYAVGRDDTQFVTAEVAFPDLWIEPTFSYERDIVRDNGTYLNLELGHAFELCDGVSLRPSVAQGFGNAKRVGGSAWAPYATKADGETPLGHAGLMDSFVKCELDWEITDGVTVAGYVGYSDFLFDRRIRTAARQYEGSGDWRYSWNFVGGLSLALAF